MENNLQPAFLSRGAEHDVFRRSTQLGYEWKAASAFLVPPMFMNECKRRTRTVVTSIAWSWVSDQSPLAKLVVNVWRHHSAILFYSVLLQKKKRKKKRREETRKEKREEKGRGRQEQHNFLLLLPLTHELHYGMYVYYQERRKSIYMLRAFTQAELFQCIKYWFWPKIYLRSVAVILHNEQDSIPQHRISKMIWNEMTFGRRPAFKGGFLATNH